MKLLIKRYNFINNLYSLYLLSIIKLWKTLSITVIYVHIILKTVCIWIYLPTHKDQNKWNKKRILILWKTNVQPISPPDTQI